MNNKGRVQYTANAARQPLKDYQSLESSIIGDPLISNCCSSCAESSDSCGFVSGSSMSRGKAVGSNVGFGEGRGERFGGA